MKSARRLIVNVRCVAHRRLPEYAIICPEGGRLSRGNREWKTKHCSQCVVERCYFRQLQYRFRAGPSFGDLLEGSLDLRALCQEDRFAPSLRSFIELRFCVRKELGGVAVGQHGDVEKLNSAEVVLFLPEIELMQRNILRRRVVFEYHASTMDASSTHLESMSSSFLCLDSARP